MFRIGAFAALAASRPSSCAPGTRRGLFRPVWVDATTGYRWLRRRPAARAAAHPRPARPRRAASPSSSASSPAATTWPRVLDRRRAALEAERRARRPAAAGARHPGRGRGRHRRPPGRGGARGDPPGRTRAATRSRPSTRSRPGSAITAGAAGRPPGTLLDDAGPGRRRSSCPIRGPLPPRRADRDPPAAGDARRLDHPPRPVRAGCPRPRRRSTRWVAAVGLAAGGTRIDPLPPVRRGCRPARAPRLSGRPGGGPRDRAPAAGRLSGSTSSIRMRLLMRPLDS